MKRIRGTYHSQIPLKGQEHLMLLEVPKLNRVLGKECLLNGICHVASPPMIKVPNGGVRRKRRSIQNQGRVLGQDPRLVLSIQLRSHVVSNTLFLLGLGELRPFNVFLRRLALDLSLFQVLYARPFLPLSLLLSWLEGRRLRGKRSGGLRAIETSGVASPAWDSSNANRLGVFF